ncbi:UDP-N-acetylmuramoyl-L-alanine--D-glutamate ligase [Salimicrobium flavidum]|uniref:UDP-N-acetylmuramoylalanine--D-glutamate ligase n=1 Tax=Salimicrobium flavidum TaxID=570947 RepID=A0A1N7ILH6_9BACI|nr:UDP-N-acetylmuramoyl-L-alanine--D-glutamate ligase [Salimicrobium flavidum]SIS37924.1 UDP-N-acetylmuramoylalanine--D-glutamate ligase [Salimicrobium flavidum]
MKQLKNFPYSSALVVGLAKSGFAAAELLQNSGVKTVVNDLNADEDSEQAVSLKDAGVSLVTGSHPFELLDKAEILVKNPGIPYENEMISEALRREIPVITEVELVSYLHEGKVIGITGSNGKTTTTTLVHRMLEADRKGVYVAGNIGEVACEVAQRTSPEDIMVIELSSFQLLGTINLHVDIAVWLNLFDSHLDYHKTRNNYISAKAKILQNQTSKDKFIYNRNDSTVSPFHQNTFAESVPFTLSYEETGASADTAFIYFNGEIVAEREKIVLVGEHNIQNCLAAVAACKSVGVSNDAIQSVLYSFQGVAHRLQYVDYKHGRYFYNDSKATNIRATSYALEAFEKPVVLLAGGLDRGNSFDELSPYLAGVKRLVLFGETASKLEILAKSLDIPFIRVKSMDEAVTKAYDASEDDEVILLSPACASWDQYRTFEERGDEFINAVLNL